MFNRQHPFVNVLLSNITESGEALDLVNWCAKRAAINGSYDKEISIIGLRFTVIVPT